MAIQVMVLDPNAASYSDNDIVTKVNNASAQITRAGAVAAAARPIETGEITNVKLASSAAKDNLDALADTARGYVKTSPTTGQFKVVALQRQADGKLAASYDDVAV